MMKKALLMITMLLFVFALVACGGDNSGEEASDEPETVSFDVEENDIFYGDTNDNPANPPTWTVSAGGEVNVNITNNGALEHNFAVVKLGETVPEPFVEGEGSTIILADSGLTAPGESSTFNFSVTDPGEYQVICTVAGHYPLMQGKLVVE